MSRESRQLEENLKKRLKKHVNFVGKFVMKYQLDISTLMTMLNDKAAEDKLAQLRDIFWTELPD